MALGLALSLWSQLTWNAPKQLWSLGAEIDGARTQFSQSLSDPNWTLMLVLGCRVVLNYSQVDVEGCTMRDSFFFVWGSWSWLITCCPALLDFPILRVGGLWFTFGPMVSKKSNEPIGSSAWGQIGYVMLSSHFPYFLKGFSTDDHARFLMDSLKQKNWCTDNNQLGASMIAAHVKIVFGKENFLSYQFQLPIGRWVLKDAWDLSKIFKFRAGKVLIPFPNKVSCNISLHPFFAVQ